MRHLHLSVANERNTRANAIWIYGTAHRTIENRFLREKRDMPGRLKARTHALSFPRHPPLPLPLLSPVGGAPTTGSGQHSTTAALNRTTGRRSISRLTGRDWPLLAGQDGEVRGFRGERTTLRDAIVLHRSHTHAHAHAHTHTYAHTQTSVGGRRKEKFGGFPLPISLFALFFFGLPFMPQ